MLMQILKIMHLVLKRDVWIRLENYDSLATQDTEDVCIKEGCTSNWAENYDPLATYNDTSITTCVLNACMSEWADNYDANATSDNGSCFREGCMVDYMDNAMIL